jgi:hypothetical protein
MHKSFSFRQPNGHESNEQDQSKKIRIINERPITSLILIRYLHKRRIPVDIATKFCKEVDHELYGKNCCAIGFKNNAGGYELRNEKFKASSSPKDITLIENKAEKTTVFEGFFNFLSYLAIHQKQEQPNTNFLILIPLNFSKKAFL